MTCRSLLAGFLGLCSLAAAVAASGELESLAKEAAQNYSTKEGQRYLEAFQKAIMPVFGKALDTCSSSMPDTKEPATIVFVVAADGTVKRLLYSTDIPFGICVGSKLRAIKALPKAPRDGWAVALGAANHHHEEQAKGPSDKPVATHGQEEVDAYDQAIAPYVAKARASYPSAKRRYLAGLPPDHTFAVWTRLYQKDEKTRENRHEDVFVVVEAIKNGTIYGWINNKLDLLTNYQKGQRIHFPESDVKKLGYCPARWKRRRKRCWKVPRALEAIEGLTNRSSQPLAAVKSTFDFMKQFSMFATLAAASGGSAPSR